MRGDSVQGTVKSAIEVSGESRYRIQDVKEILGVSLNIGFRESDNGLNSFYVTTIL